MINRVLLTLVFTLSFLTYLTPELSVSVQFVPLALFAVMVFVRVFCSDSVLRAIGSLFELDGLFFVLFLSLFILRPSIGSGYNKSPGFALFICICLILARLYMAVVPIREVLEAFFWSGILSLGFFIPLGFAGLMQSVETLARFSPFSFHPNLLAFVLAGYFCVMVWKLIAGGWRMKILAGLVGCACLLIIFFAASRGSIVGIFAGCLFIAGMAIVRARREQRKKFARLGLLAAALLLGLLLFIRNLEWTKDAFTYVDEVLQFSNEYRGFDSGLSGRLDKWNKSMRVFTDGTFLIGRGIRSTDLSETTVIDNSYLVILYEIGLVPLILITWRFLTILRRFIRAYFHVVTQNQKFFYLTCTLLMVVLLVNNVVARLLFGVGNPYSLVAFLLFAAPTWQIEQCPSHSASGPSQSKRLANWHAENIQPSS